MGSNLRRIVQTSSAMLILLSSHPAGARESGEEQDTPEASVPEHFFDRGRYEAALTSGVLFSFSGPRHDRSPINYTVTGMQLGYMLGDVKGDGWWRGNLELAGEGFGSSIFEGDGSYIAGGTLWLRYNFVPRGWWGLVPYAQAGAGAVSTDIDHGIVGQPFNFNLDLGLGARYFVGRNWSLNLEYRYQHISNAGLDKHNLGINADGPILGASYFF
jgi:opacity protein-like surface antigen